MSNDRELLELAAKAAGRGSQWWMESVWNGPDREWNPLTDDGDALRLAVMLGICPAVDQKQASAMVSLDAVSWCDLEEVGNDPYAATRRAIVRAAAEIGRNMK